MQRHAAAPLRYSLAASRGCACAVRAVTGTVDGARAHLARAFSAGTGVDISKYEFIAPLHTKNRGVSVVHDPWTNKGTAFPLSERDRLGIRGLVPPALLPLEGQVAKILSSVRQLKDPLEQSVFLNDLCDRNETLFYRLLIDNMEEFAPIVYTPTVGLVCQRFGSYFRRARGMYFSAQDRGLMGTMVYNWPRDDVEVVVVTDGSRILGLGDLGANGMGIPIGKLMLYVGAGGIDPKRVLPVCLDAGTDNVALREQAWYLGLAQPRLKGDDYFSLVHEFVNAVHYRWPNAVIQFEDFSSDKASDILEAYRYDHLCFNDDIQGTGAVALASLMAAIRIQGPGARLRDQRIVICGAGSAGLGVAQSLYDAMLQEGCEPDDARVRIWVCDKDGLLGPERDRSALSPAAAFFTRDHAGGAHLPSVAGTAVTAAGDGDGGAWLHGAGLGDRAPVLDVVLSARPTIMLGLTGVGGTWTEAIVRGAGAGVARPILFPLSNPTSHAECTSEQAYRWTDGRALVASGSPFPPTLLHGRTLTPSQTNNMYIFPGVGLGATAVQARRITDRMLFAAARALSELVTDEQLEAGMVLPPVSDIRRVAARVAAAVAASAIADGIVQRMPPSGDLVRYMTRAMYDPRYAPIV